MVAILQNAIINTIVSAAQAGENIILPAFRTNIETDKKTDGSFVTIYDKRAEKAIAQVLKSTYPDIPILGEEGTEDRTQSYWSRDDVNIRFVVDPIDGTTNFAGWNPDFGTMISLEKKIDGVWTAQEAIIWMPAKQTGYIAAKDQGCFRINGLQNPEPEQVKVNSSKKTGLSGALVDNILYHKTLDKAGVERAALSSIRDGKGKTRTTGSSAAMACKLINQETDAMVTGNLSPWDLSAPDLCLTEAGCSKVFTEITTVSKNGGRSNHEVTTFSPSGSLAAELGNIIHDAAKGPSFLDRSGS